MASRQVGMRKKPRQDRSEQTVAKVLEAADEVFGEVGVHKATTTTIATRAGLSVGGLYRFFPDKTAIAAALSDLYLGELEALFGTVAPIVAKGDLASIRPAVTATVQGIARLHEKHPGYFAVAAHLHPSQATSPAHHVRDTQVEALSAWFSVARNAPAEPERRRMAEFLIDTTRVLIELAPATGSARRDHLEEIERMMSAYLYDRLS